MQDAGWGSPYRNAGQLINSEYMAFSLIACGQTWNWQQGYARQPGLQVADHTNTDATWVSNTTISTGSGTPPPGYVSASSLAWNMNNYATRYQNGSLLFNMDVLGTGPSNWKSAFNSANANDVPDYELGYSAAFEWEWAMVYEWSVLLTSQNCAGSPISINATSSHHSPPKDDGP
jgi:hypothetical protein